MSIAPEDIVRRGGEVDPVHRTGAGVEVVVVVSIDWM
jgi:hypothetical protein